MSILAPKILLPSGGADYATNIANQTLSGTTDENTQEILVNGSTHGVSYTPGETAWAWNGTIALGSNKINIVAIEKDTGNESTPATITITLLKEEDFITVSPPTGIRLRRYRDKIEVITTKNPESQVVGYNFYVSTQSGGINGVYAKMNTELVTDEAFFEDFVKNLSKDQEKAGNIRITTITDEIERRHYYSYFFTENIYDSLVSQGEIEAVGFNQDSSFFFVITAVIYDPVLGEVTESTLSAELEGSVITITTGIQDLPARTQNDIILSYSRDILTANAGADTKPGTVLRDMIDPISEETARMYVIQDFLSRSLSVTSLLDFDDSDGDGESDIVSESANKRALQVALNLENTESVQTLIDEQFDKLASNVNVIRRGAEPATGTVIFYTETAPIRDMIIQEGALVSTTGDLDAGITAQSYEVLSTRILDFETREEFYNSETNRYELEVGVQAVDSGEDTNTDSYTITNIDSGVDSDFTVENPNPISFGQDRESNQDLAARIQLAFFTDTGTEGGYAKVSVGVPGVRNVRVEKAGDELMRRDWDALREEHVGGKVDVYVQGDKEEQVQDQIAFSFESVANLEGSQQGEIFNVINAVAFQFQSKNPNVTAHTPIFEVTKVHNATKSADYDLAGYQIIGDGDTVDIDETLPTNLSIGLSSTDVIRVDYKYRSSDVFVLQRQPVIEIVSVVGQLSGTLTRENYELVRLQDPLEEGNSTAARDGIRIKYANNLPITGFQEIKNEEHVLIIDTDEALNYLGADPESIIVTNTDKSITYKENIDYTISFGTDTEPTTIRMIETGAINTGQTVYISYNAIENFTITYRTNGLLNNVQDEIDSTKHACADVIVKQAIKNDVDLVINVIPKSGVTNLTQLTSQIRTAVSNYVSQLIIGRSLTQSEIVEIITELEDVDYVSVPFLKMVKADESLITRDNIGQTQFEIFNEGVITSYITAASVLTFETIDKGGPENSFKGIFENSMPLVLQDTPLDVSGGPGRGYIQSDGKIIVSTRDGNLPDTKEYQVGYWVYGETGAKDITVNSVEYLDIGNFSITYDTPRDLTRQAL